MTIAIITFLSLFSFILIGIPISIAIGLASLVGFLVNGTSLLQMVSTVASGVDSFTILAIPFFLFSGTIMEKGGMSRRIVQFAESLLCWMSGGLGHVVVIASMFFAALSGSAPATCAAIGSAMIPQMKNKGYPAEFSAALQSVAATIGPIIPPSIGMIVYGVAAGVSIGKLFAAGILPGILYGIALMLTAGSISKKEHFGYKKPFSAGEVWRSFKDAIWALLVPGIILGGIYTGVFTPTEAGAVAAVYAIVVCLFIYKELDLKELLHTFGQAASNTSMVLMILACSTAFSWIITSAGIGKLLGGWFMHITTNPTIFMALVVVLLLFMGCFLDSNAIILIITPVLAPVATALGIDLVHFGIVIVMVTCLGISTPPVGENLYIAAGIAGVKFESMVPYVIKFVIAATVICLLVAFVPQISMFLPNLIY
ncbi:TRAP transporter large permease [uncultured Oscillibacter sp.]|uniref:TRAP transporter large permease n=1 Tax=uncultured Oscillibacter sp. TaxID=876091 RepID=UPI0025F876DD|nr:TRAP transporter large permease [uncultured Oscillibacter sp.]